MSGSESEQPFDAQVLKRLIGAQQADQFAETLRSLASWLAAYSQSLAEQGLSQQMAEELVLDYHWLLVGSMLFKDGGLPPRSY